jgi:hypothetical protein
LGEFLHPCERASCSGVSILSTTKFSGGLFPEFHFDFPLHFFAAIDSLLYCSTVHTAQDLALAFCIGKNLLSTAKCSGESINIHCMMQRKDETPCCKMQQIDFILYCIMQQEDFYIIIDTAADLNAAARSESLLCIKYVVFRKP